MKLRRQLLSDSEPLITVTI